MKRIKSRRRKSAPNDPERFHIPDADFENLIIDFRSFIRQAKQESRQQVIDSLKEWAEKNNYEASAGEYKPGQDVIALSDLVQKLDGLQKAEKYDRKR